MRALGFAFIWLGNILMGFAVILILVAVGYGWYQHGFGWVQEVYSPFNIANVIVTVVVLAPGYGLRILGEKIVSSSQQS